MKIYSLYDRKAREFGALLLGATDEMMVRAAKDGIPRESTVYKYPEDFDLMCLGEVDLGTGWLVRQEPLPRLIAPMSAVLGELSKEEA